MILPTIDINYGNEAGLEGIDLDALSAKAIEATITNAGLVVPKDAELSLLICDDNLIQELNGQWRGKHNPTNVLSFSGDNSSPLLGDIVISVDTVQREAALENKIVEDHITHLIVHGFLHLFGYDHESEVEAEEMENLETQILGELGIANPYENA